MTGKWRIWIDRGGTFTDLVAQTPEGDYVTHKLLSENPERYADAAIQGIRDLLGVEPGAPIPSTEIDHIKMGTTVATNALLERKGERTGLIISRGFGDALRIGYQNRPRLFDLDIRLPEMLYETVIEADERVGADGRVLLALDERALEAPLQALFDSGVRAVAVAFAHGFRYPDHERRVGELCREMGFTQVSLSHEASPLIKLVSRADTAVVDAYLSPILRRYVNQVSGALGARPGGGPDLMFMQSNGGLTDAQRFQGKDAILSGPAGGVVGMARTAEMNGVSHVIGFDMGGTSTDVAHYDGEFERSLETTVAGVRIRAPMMHIHTVAAGGGSVLRFDGARFRVGPESAGANPGPACYRRGGPLTVTDCNVLLGKIQPHHFPSIFGPEGDAPLDHALVERRFAELAERVSSELNVTMTQEDVAEGFLNIAVENMANAIKKISVQRGHDITRYTLNCFGGAGGQHACLVADALGIEHILLHPFAGVLSAYGMGLADARAAREVQLGVLLDDRAVDEIEPAIERLTTETRTDLDAQGFDAQKTRTEIRLHVRLHGSDTTLRVPHGTTREISGAFERAHRQRYGFYPEGDRAVIESIEVESIASTGVGTEETGDRHTHSHVINPIDSISMRSGGGRAATPVYRMADLPKGQVIAGPALIVEPNGTIVLEREWQGAVNDKGHLLLQRAQPRTASRAIGTRVDPVMLEVFNNLFMSIAEQMGATLQNTSHSVNIKERLDFSCALFDAGGSLVANAPHVPVHLGSMGESVRAIIDANRGDMRPGDAFALNSPYHGGTHLPDVTVISPVFDDAGRDVLFYVGSRGHHADIGGRTPGSSPPDSTHIEEEGVLIENFRAVRDDKLADAELRALLSSGRYPCRNVEQNMSDLGAQIAANATGRRELLRLVNLYGIETVHAYMSHVQDNAEESVRRVIDRLSDGACEYRMDDGRVIRVSIRVNLTKRSATIDFTGTSAQDPGNYNAPSAVTRAAVLYVMRTLVEDDIPLNQGCMAPIELIIPQGSMLAPSYPAAVMAGNTEISQAVTNALYAALGVLAASQGTMNNFTYGNDRFQNYETICGGTGAGPDHDGASAVHSHMTNTRMTDPEVLEQRYPVVNEAFALRRGSGGRGAHRGGDGVVRKLRFLEPATATLLTSHRTEGPPGLQGGEAGAPGRNLVIRADGTEEVLEANDEVQLEAGDTIVIETPGGGGFGKPSSPLPTEV